MKTQPSSSMRATGRPRTYSKEQRAIQKEFCDAYDFTPEQVGFDGPSLDPIFDFRRAHAALGASL